jgi:hypothetical protein
VQCRAERLKVNALGREEKSDAIECITKLK